MLTSKQRAYLRKLSNGIPAVVQVGKLGVTPEVTAAISEVLAARELVKIAVLNNCLIEVHEIAQTVSERTRADIVTVVGKKVTLFRQNREKSGFDLPKGGAK